MRDSLQQIKLVLSDSKPVLSLICTLTHAAAFSVVFPCLPFLPALQDLRGRRKGHMIHTWWEAGTAPESAARSVVIGTCGFTCKV